MQNELHPQHRTHTWIIILLFWVLAATLFVAGYMIYGKNEDSLNTEKLAAACADALNDDTETPTEEPTVCDEPQDGEVAASSSHPSFAYPNGWHVFGSSNFIENGLVYTTYVSPDPQFLCADCDMLIRGVQIRTGEKDAILPKGTASTHLDAFIAQYQDDTSGSYSNVTVSASKKPNGKLAIIRGENGENSFGGPGTFEVYVFEGDEYLSVVYFDDLEEQGVDTDGTDEWPIIRDSLDFSEIR